MKDNESTDKKYYYPDNLLAPTLILNLWSFKDLGVIFGLVAINLLLIIFAHVFVWTSLIVVYIFCSGRVVRGYSIVKMAVLYIRFLFTDKLKFDWR